MVGNIPNFTKIDVLRCFLRFNKNIGRQELARDLELGEGTIRSILQILKSRKLLDSTKKGHLLSKKGSDALSQINNYLSVPKILLTQSIYPEFKKIGIVLRNVAKLRELYKLRDIAVKNGAEGAILLRYDQKLYAPEFEYEQDYSEIEKNFAFAKDDVMIICFANIKRNAENGALAIAIELNNSLKKFINEV